MTLSKCQDGYLNKQVILFRSQYETHSLQMHPEFPCRSVVALTPKLSEQQYVLRLVVSPCQYLPSPSPFFQPISPSPSSHTSSVAVPHILYRRIRLCCPTSTPPCSSAAVFTADLVCNPYYPVSSPHLHFYLPTSLLLSLSHYLPPLYVLRCRCFSTFSNQIFSSICVVLY